MPILRRVAVEGLTLLFLTVNSAFALQGPSAHFDTDKAEVLNAKTIVEFAKEVSGRTTDLRLYCHTDTRGSVDYNIKLAERRCKSVSQLLNNHGVGSRSFVIFGERSPEIVEAGRDIAGRRGVNRRVEIFYDLQETVVETKWRRHRIKLLGGYAPSGLKPTKQTGPNTFVVEEDWDVEFGIGYSFRITRRFNLGIEGFTNKSGFLSFGMDF